MHNIMFMLFTHGIMILYYKKMISYCLLVDHYCRWEVGMVGWAKNVSQRKLV